jgi:hypothetical protein
MNRNNFQEMFGWRCLAEELQINTTLWWKMKDNYFFAVIRDIKAIHVALTHMHHKTCSLFFRVRIYWALRAGLRRDIDITFVSMNRFMFWIIINVCVLYVFDEHLFRDDKVYKLNVREDAKNSWLSASPPIPDKNEKRCKNVIFD